MTHREYPLEALSKIFNLMQNTFSREGKNFFLKNFKTAIKKEYGIETRFIASCNLLTNHICLPLLDIAEINKKGLISSFLEFSPTFKKKRSKVLYDSVFCLMCNAFKIKKILLGATQELLKTLILKFAEYFFSQNVLQQSRLTRIQFLLNEFLVIETNSATRQDKKFIFFYVINYRIELLKKKNPYYKIIEYAEQN
jgi:hypothetical protein